MNVLKKIKSKHKQFDSSQQITQLNAEQTMQLNLNYEQQQSDSLVCSKVKSQDKQKRAKRLPLVACQKSIGEIDQDELVLNQYISKKQKREQDMKRISLFKLVGEQELKDCPFCLYIKKSYNVGSICLFQGQVGIRKEGKQERKRKMHVSCGLETIQLPENIQRIYLNKLTFLNETEGVFCTDNIMKLKERGSKKY